MGNTCFMNSALQCFVHSPVFREYFLSNRFECDVNKRNHLGSRGAIAAAYSQLQSSLWRERDQGYLLPGRFRDEFTRVRRHFEETRQYDAHEFMVALLDCLHEDLNQGSQVAHAEAPGVPSYEAQGDAAWRAYTSVNSSVVVDLFHGQMRSETICGTCGERKCTFDPNLFFSLPIPESNPPMYAIPLAKCMDALMREEAISLEDHWVCERCGVPREGSRLSAIWRLPDLVMIQMKRFQYLENQHKQKVRSLVDFPLKGMDFSKWMGHQDEGSSVYDLYAVANHVGGLTRGHYTAYCRYDADFPESSALFSATEDSGNVQCPDLWFRFDDEKVSEIAAGDVITDAAYVLFYKR
eukprot:jgi/Phyca11/562505/estExt2_Genewise1.C_PHYCAscaffold_90513